MNALDLALANAAANAPKDEELHLKNLDSIADPTQDEPDYYPESEPDKLTLDSIDYKLGEITNFVMHIHSEQSLTKLRLHALADMITTISTTITTAASMSSEPNHKHRSLHEWDDSTLLNELVERENDLMPFYFELLKRINSPELQSLVMSSMQGKNASMVTLAQLCSALAPQSIQPEPRAQDPNEYVHVYRQDYVDPKTLMPIPPQQQAVPKQQYFETPPTYNPYFKER